MADSKPPGGVAVQIKVKKVSPAMMKKVEGSVADKKQDMAMAKKATSGKCMGCGKTLKDGKCPGCGSAPSKCKCGK